MTTLTEVFRRSDILGEALVKIMQEQGGDDGGWAVPLLVVIVHTYLASGLERRELHECADEAWDLLLSFEHIQKELLRLATTKGPVH